MRTDYRKSITGFKNGVHHTIRAVITLGFAFFIAYLVKGEYMNLYIAPRMTFIVKLSAITLYLIGMIELIRAYRQFFGKQQTYDCNCGAEHEHDHAHDHAPTGSVWKHTAIYGLFVLPLLLGFLMPNVTMGTALAAKKGMNLSASSSGRISPPSGERIMAGDNSVKTPTPASIAGDNSAASPANTATDTASSPAIDDTVSQQKLDELFQADMYTEDFARLAKQIYSNDVIEVTEELFMEILTTLDIFIDPFQGKKVEISGFVYREPDMSENQFVIGRFAMDCCSADALPYGVLVEFDKANQYANDTWLTLNGTISKSMYQDIEIMMFVPDELTQIETPASPYVYPNYDF